MKFLLTFLKSLTNREIPSTMNVHWKKSTNKSTGMPEKKFDAAYGTIFTISKCFQRSKQNLHINFSLELGKLKI